LIGIQDLFGSIPNKVLVVGIGGGGDVVSAATLALWLRRYGLETFIGSIAWERFVIDPVPGPIPFNSFYNAEKLSEHILVANRDTYVVRGSKEFKPQVSLVSEAINEPVYVFDLWKGVNGYREGVRELIEYLGIDAVIALDVGGDVLAKGNEDNLWSPLADSMGLACFNSFKDTVLAVHGIGSDGELDPDYLLSRIALIAREGGLLGAKGLTSYEADLLEKILSKANSEASRIPLLAYRGYYGEHVMRLGTRKIHVTPLQAITFYLDIRLAYKYSPLAQQVDNTASLDKANNRLNKIRVYTEYDLEKDLYKLSKVELTAETIESTRAMGRNRLLKHFQGL